MQWTGLSTDPYYTNLFFLDPLAEAQACVNTVRTLITNLAPGYTTYLQAHLQAEVVQIDPATDKATAAVSVSPGAVIPGTGSTELLPTQVQGLIKFNTPVYIAGRRIQGRMYVPGACEGENNQTPSSTYVARLQSAANGYLAAAVTADVQPVIYSRKNGTYALISSAVGEGQWATLRGRGARG